MRSQLARVAGVSRHALPSVIAVETLALLASAHQIYARDLTGAKDPWVLVGAVLILVVPPVLMWWYASSRRRFVLWGYAVAQWTTIAGFGFFGPAFRRASLQLVGAMGDVERLGALLDSLAPGAFMKVSGVAMILAAGFASLVSMRFYRENGLLGERAFAAWSDARGAS